MATLERDAEASRSSRLDTVYVFNIELDIREKSRRRSPRRTARRCRRTRSATRACARRSTSPSTGQALAEIAMEGLGKPVNQIVTPDIFGLQSGAAGAEAKRREGAQQLMAEAGYPNGFKVDLQLHQRPPARRPGRRHRCRADARPHRHRRAGRRPAGRRVLPGPHPRRPLDGDVGLGHADRRGALHALLASAIPTTRSAASAPSTGAATRTRRSTS